MTRIIQITPTYPPDISGVGDYAALLGRTFEVDGHPMRTLVARPEVWYGDGAKALARAEALELAKSLGDTNRVLLHFSGYGYARRGLCGWLVDGLARWKAEAQHRRIVTMFHEVYATGPIWRSSFWTALPQKRIARDLARLSDAAFVSSYAGQKLLHSLVPGLDVGVLPVFSNIGEPDMPPPLSGRGGQAVIFGSVAQRRRVHDVLSRAAESVALCLQQYGVTRILDIGPDAAVPPRIGSIEVARLGPLPAQQVSEILAASRIGFIDYPGNFFTKSGIAAAYFAHRLLIVNTSPVGAYPPDLLEGQHFVGLSALISSAFPAQEIADSGHAWYLKHGLAAAAKKFEALLV